ncbi:MAG: flavin reductase family protein [Chitinophagaceae bacterium]
MENDQADSIGRPQYRKINTALELFTHSAVSLDYKNIMQQFNLSDIESWEKIYRANFINSLTGFKSANLIGTINGDGQTNVAMFSSIVHIGSNPALIGFINRPRTSTTHTLSNIESTGVYTINQIHPSFLEAAHQTSAKYPVDQSEFDITGLTPQFIAGIEAPFVEESRVKIGLRLAEIIPIKLNDTFLVIGRVIFVMMEDQILGEDGFLALDQSGTIASNGNDTYYSTQVIRKFPYARP